MDRQSDRLARSHPSIPEVPRPVTTPTEPRSGGPRLRARAKAGTNDELRPEVTDALAALERSIGEVAAAERIQASAPAGVDDPGSVRPIVAEGEPGGLELGLAATAAAHGAVADDAPAPDLDLGPLLARSEDEDHGAAWAVIPGSPGQGHPGDRKARRRRNGRIVSWAGAVLLVGLAAWLLLPSSRSTNTTDRTTTTDGSTTTTLVTASSIDGPVFTTPTTAAAPVVTTPDTVASGGTTATTVRRRTTTTATPATTVPATTPPTQAPATTQPAPPPTTTTSTMPPATTTTCAVGGVPDPVNGTC